VVEGGEVSMFYDPMIAKLITHAPTREAAIDAQIAALDAFEIDGIGHNVDFLSALMQHPRFRAGNLETDFIADEYPHGFHGAPSDEQLTGDLAAIAALIAAAHDARAAEVDGQLGPPIALPLERVMKFDGIDHHVAFTDGGVVVDGGKPVAVDADYVPGQRLVQAEVDGRKLIVRVARNGRGWKLTTRGASHKVQVLAPHVAELARHMIEKVPPDLSRLLIAPMPGLLTKLNVKAGDKVEAGQPVAVMEAMKMENILRAPKAATVKATPAMAGDSLAVDQVIVEFE
jgi:propionyl-CoA carboxylase alpha chain